MDAAVGVVTLLASAIAIVLTAAFVRPRVARPAADLLLAVGGAGLGVGGLLLLDDVGTASWFVAPAALAILVPAHVRALFAGEGPFRT